MPREIFSILAPVDFSAASRKALREAGRLAARMGASLTLLHVLEWPWEEPPAPAEVPGFAKDGRLGNAGVGCQFAFHPLGRDIAAEGSDEQVLLAPGQESPSAAGLRSSIFRQVALPLERRQLMRLQAETGSRHQALQQYQQCREAVRKELDSTPEPAT